jgi:hypothetical protein
MMVVSLLKLAWRLERVQINRSQLKQDRGELFMAAIAIMSTVLTFEDSRRTIQVTYNLCESLVEATRLLWTKHYDAKNGL